MDKPYELDENGILTEREIERIYKETKLPASAKVSTSAYPFLVALLIAQAEATTKVLYEEELGKIRCKYCQFSINQQPCDTYNECGLVSDFIKYVQTILSTHTVKEVQREERERVTRELVEFLRKESDIVRQRNISNYLITIANTFERIIKQPSEGKPFDKGGK